MNSLYGLGREGFAGGDLDWDAHNIKVILGDAADYTVQIDVHQFLTSIGAPARVAVSGNLINKTKALGVMDADDVVLPNVNGDACAFIAIFMDSGVEATSRLIAYIDTATGLPVAPNGGNITIQWDQGSAKIFRL